MLYPCRHLPPFFHLVTSWHPTAPHLEPGTPCPGLWSPPGGQMEWMFLCTCFTFPPSSLRQRPLVTKNIFPPACFCTAKLTHFSFPVSHLLLSLLSAGSASLSCPRSVGVSRAPPLTLSFPSPEHFLSASPLPRSELTPSELGELVVQVAGGRAFLSP